MQRYIVHQAPTHPLARQLKPVHSFPTHYVITTNAEEVKTLKEINKVDINPIPDGWEPNAIKLIISDMDSTLISIECIDEIAKHSNSPNLGKRIAAITEQAMQGNMDFYTALEARLALLEGIPVSVLERVYKTQLKLNPGAEILLNYLAQKDIPFALVSGGFTFFTDLLQQRLPIRYAKANQLEISQNHLTGKLIGAPVGPIEKRLFLEQLCQQLQISPYQTIAVGDGANDLEMMEVAKLSIAFRAKPVVQQHCDWQLNHAGLDAITTLWQVEH